MQTLALVGVGFVALEHVGFLVLEMFLFDTPTGRKIFALTEQQSRDAKPLAMNQGLYNGFLTAGLVWSFFLDAPFAFQVRVFFLACVLVAGIFGGLTAKRSILVMQALPAAIALAVVFLAR